MGMKWNYWRAEKALNLYSPTFLFRTRHKYWGRRLIYEFKCPIPPTPPLPHSYKNVLLNNDRGPTKYFIPVSTQEYFTDKIKRRLDYVTDYSERQTQRVLIK